jgi:predicted AlkP superfamily pyrophosphatase or phosphodiesterase
MAWSVRFETLILIPKRGSREITSPVPKRLAAVYNGLSRSTQTLLPFLPIMAARLGPNSLLCATLALGAVAGFRSLRPDPKPTLLLFLTVDQLTPVYFDKFRTELHGGLARLLDGGAVFVNAHQDHAITETAPGHASTMSGRFPRSTGITRNLLGVNDDSAPLIGSPDPGASPRRFRGTTLTDWLTTVDPKTRALSVSMKDRAAILPIGRSKQQIYWFTVNGLFTTSNWYADTLPPWVRSFNARRIPASYTGKQWTLLRDPKEYAEPDSVPAENGGRDFLFPHRFPKDTTAAIASFRLFPMMDEATFQFALAGLSAMDLGRGPTTDVLAISLSATDVIGHMFGMDSREQHDQILRLDRQLGLFLDSLYRLRDSTKILIALTADHGVPPAPELAGSQFSPPPRRVRIGPAFRPLIAALKRAGGDSLAPDFESGAVFLDPTHLGTLTVPEAVKILAEGAKQVPGVLRVDLFADFAKSDLNRDPVARRWLHMFPPDMVPAAVIELTPGSIYDYGLTATHGSANDYDTHVPMIYYGLPFKRGTYSEFVRTVDIGPTLAAALHVKPTEALDGHVLTDAFKAAPNP